MYRRNRRAKLEKASIVSCVRRGMDGLMSLRRMRAVMIISIRRLVGFFVFVRSFSFTEKRRGKGQVLLWCCEVLYVWRCSTCDSAVYERSGSRRVRECGWDVRNRGVCSTMKSYGPFMARDLKKGEFVVGVKIAEQYPCPFHAPFSFSSKPPSH